MHLPNDLWVTPHGGGRGAVAQTHTLNNGKLSHNDLKNIFIKIPSFVARF